MPIKPLQSSQAFALATQKRSPLFYCLVVIASICSKGTYAANNEIIETNPANSVDPVSVDFRNGRLSVSAKQVPVVDLMQRIGDEVGFEVTAYGDFIDQSISMSFSEVQLAKAVRRLLRNTSAVVSYSNSSGSDEAPAISRIYLLGASSATVNPIRIETLEPGLAAESRLDQIQSDDSEARIASIDRAEGLADEITLENLSFSLRHDPDPEVRLRAISALEQIGGSTAVDALESGLGDDRIEVRKKVVQTLGNIDDDRIPLWLGQVLMGDPSAEVRLVAVQSIARKEGDIARIFLEAATGDSSSDVSNAALGLLR